MSQIPKTNRQPKPKAPSNATVASAEHDRLLRRVWAVAEDIAVRVHLARSEDIEALVTKEAANYFAKMDRALASTDDWIGQCRDTAMQAAIIRLKKRLQSAKSSKLPAIEDSLKIESKVMAAPIVQTAGPRHERRVVGYIDIEIKLSAPHRPRLSFDDPYDTLSARLGDKGPSQAKDATKTTASEIDSLCKNPPSWEYDWRDQALVWIDVRPTLEPIGQVVRDLKVLREHVGPITPIVVAHAKSDKVGQSILANEGFFSIAEEYLPLPDAD